MKSLDNRNPFVLALCYGAVIGIAMFSFHPLLLLLACLGSLVNEGILCRTIRLRSLGGMLLLFLMMALLNPIFSHNGTTILFLFNNTPITWEATAYGLTASAMIVTVLLWFSALTVRLTSDKLLYLFGALSPRLALLLSMTLRYLPLFRRQANSVRQTQMALGLYREDTLLDRVRGGLRTFSVMITWALENGITTADSMAARGYGSGKRTSLTRYRLRAADIGLIGLILLLLTPTSLALATDTLHFTFYPTISYAAPTPLGLIAILSYALLAFLPAILEIGERIQWNFLRWNT
ncbi:MAG: cobalt transport protein [Ruminococcaceae bacterium]|nr:cobalt transport protein [Oscillospiraceae bacterium]